MSQEVRSTKVDMKRRKFLAISTLSSAAYLAGTRWSLPQGIKAVSPSTFDFIFFTDTHIQPELDAAKGCMMCFDQLRNSRTDFAIQGGGHVYDASGVDVTRAESLYDLYAKTEKTLQMPVHHVIGNHDVVGVYEKSGLPLSDPRQGKRAYENRIGKTYYSFDHKGYHFIVLDSIQLTA